MSANSLLPLLETAARYFADKGVDEPRLSAELLLAGALKLERRLDLYMQFERPISEEELQIFRGYSRRRIVGEPVQYILGEAHFYGLCLEVGSGVLIPRPETELLVEKVVNTLRGPDSAGRARLLDLGTGCGCIPLAVCSEIEACTAMGIDRSPEALAYAIRNADRLGYSARVEFRLADMMSLSALETGMFDVVTANPPYIPGEEISSTQIEVRNFEPRIALDGGLDGLDLYRSTIPLLPAILKPEAMACFEIGHDQGQAVAALFRDAGLTAVEVLQDYSNLDRLVVGYQLSV